MQKLFQAGYGFFLVAAVFLIVSVVTERIAVYLSLAVVFFILGLGARKKSSQKPSQDI